MTPKYRAWHKQKRMCEVVMIDFSHKEVNLKTRDSFYMEDLDKVELMQWTGLQDKNDKDIYEGDVVKIFHDTKFERIDQIVWNEYRAGFDKAGAPGAYLFGGEQIEVIGNIYQDSHLLKEGE